MSAIRPATPQDVPAILRMIHELAHYEKEPDAVRNTPEMLEQVLFGANPRVFAAMAENGEGEVQGFALWFLNYSTWEGVHENGYARVEWSVLDWNEPSINFYRSLGARPMDGWSTFRLTGEALAQFGSVVPAAAHG